MRGFHSTVADFLLEAEQNKPGIAQDDRMQDMMVDHEGEKYKAICARLGLPEQLYLACSKIFVSREVCCAALV